MARLLRAALAAAIVSSSACVLSLGGLTGNAGSASDASADALVDAGDESSAVFEGGLLCALADAALCDDFDRSTALAPGAPWSMVACDDGGALSVNGALVTKFGTTSAVNVQCALQSNETPAVGRFSLDFDMTFSADAANGGIVIAAISIFLPAVDARGVLDEQFQFALSQPGRGEIGVILHYPNAALSPNGSSYPYYMLAAVDGFVAPSAPCHISMEVDALTPSVIRATSTCAGKMVAMVPKASSSPPGISGAATLHLGYGHTESVSVPAWSISYDNLVFRREP